MLSGNSRQKNNKNGLLRQPDFVCDLARREITVMFDEIHQRLPNLMITGEPARLQSFFINGIKRMRCAWR